MKRLARTLAFFSLASGCLLFFDPKPRFGPLPATLVRYLRIIAGGLAFFTALSGLIGAVLGLLSRSPLTLVSGGIGALLSARHVSRVTAAHPGFEEAFGDHWSEKVPPELASGIFEQRWSWRLPPVPLPLWKRDIPFYTIPGSGRPLLCDLWLPAAGVAPSGLAFIYYHGGAWRTLNKDTLTRTFFRRLAAQGHVLMDVAYRLYPEATMFEMVGDAKRAVAWLKAKANEVGLDPERIVVGGGSAGGHLALLVAYTPNHPELTPNDLQGVDTSVRAAVAYYPVVDLFAYVKYRAYEPFELGPLAIPGRQEVVAGLVGGLPDETPGAYALYSPASHVQTGCPPSLLLVPEHDDIVPLEPIRDMYRALLAAGTPSILVEFQGAEHGFDLALPRYSPAAQAALHDVQRFLAIMANSDQTKFKG